MNNNLTAKLNEDFLQTIDDMSEEEFTNFCRKLEDYKKKQKSEQTKDSSFASIARSLGLSETGTRKTCRRALAKLRKNPDLPELLNLSNLKQK